MKDPITWGRNEENIEQHLRERGERGFSEFDWWNFDEYLTFVIIGGLKKFADPEHAHGHPCDLPSFEAWQAVLRAIIAGFEAHQRLVSLDGWNIKDTEEQHRQWSKHNMALWENGSKLFIKYFGNFWD